MPYTPSASNIVWESTTNELKMDLDLLDDNNVSVGDSIQGDVTFTFKLVGSDVLGETTVSRGTSFPAVVAVEFSVYDGTSPFVISAASFGNYSFIESASYRLSATQIIQPPQNLPPAGGGGAICFLGNAPVLTPSGYRRMDSLRAGDKVTTPNGGTVAIEAVKIMSCAAGPETNPYVIPKGEFGATKRVLISPRHRVATRGGMIEAQHLGLAQEERTGTLTYYNLALPGWANMIVAGVEVESLAPVERIAMPLATFKSLIEKKYGSTSTPAVREMIRNTCRFLQNGMVECPVMRR
jgi:hypothetical protein